MKAEWQYEITCAKEAENRNGIDGAMQMCLKRSRIAQRIGATTRGPITDATKAILDRPEAVGGDAVLTLARVHGRSDRQADAIDSTCG